MGCRQEGVRHSCGERRGPGLSPPDGVNWHELAQVLACWLIAVAIKFVTHFGLCLRTTGQAPLQSSAARFLLSAFVRVRVSVGVRPGPMPGLNQNAVP